MNKAITIHGNFENKEQVLSVLPFYFNENNSDITVSSFIDGDVEISVCFGTGKGWNSINSDLAVFTESSYQWGLHTLGLGV